MIRTVGAHLVATLYTPVAVELQVAVAQPCRTESLVVTLDGEPAQAREVRGDHGTRLHLVDLPPGRLEVRYNAEVEGHQAAPPVHELDASRYLRPSRYAESDRFIALAATEFGGLTEPAELLPAVAAWVGNRLSYALGSSQGTDGAVETLLAGRGVCRDYAHLTVALLRARDVPARLVSAYAPGLNPMDFHAVAEALVDGQWQVIDATLLAPRSTLVRIATGRDAADTAFLSNYGGLLELEWVSVLAYTDGVLPGDDLSRSVSLG